ncbi:MAG: hypothetical protein OXC63_08390 [Aestuariivita sp.]|nr:hypothetical protein [Aestuariivita sp.]MCY4345410.1 hypothetical protein [Aestuariivita sp.]
MLETSNPSRPPAKLRPVLCDATCAPLLAWGRPRQGFSEVVAAAAVAVALTALPHQAAASTDYTAQTAWLDGLEQQLVRTSGHLISLRFAGRNLRGIFYSPLAVFWRLTDEGVSHRALLHRDGDKLYFVLGGTTLLATQSILNVQQLGFDRHYLARFHDHLLQVPLAETVAGLPANSRFLPPPLGQHSGVVQRPDAPERATLWESRGHALTITYPDGSSRDVDWQHVQAALAPIE